MENDIQGLKREINLMYGMIIQNYVDLNIYFELQDPLEIYMLFQKLLHKGYFSYGYKFNYDEEEKDILNIPMTRGVYIINGSGVCRHVSAMLKDVYNMMNINNAFLTVYFLDENKDNKLHFIGNHVINIASFDHKCYLLDPTNGFIWKKKDGKNLVAISHRKINRAKISSIIDLFDYNHSDISTLINIKKMLLLPQIDESYQKKIKEEVNNIYKRNLYLFEEFRNRNRILYDEINSDLVKIKRKL